MPIALLRQALPFFRVFMLTAGAAQAHPEPWLDFGLERSLLRAETRQFPVDFSHGRAATLLVSRTQPAGYASAGLPKSKALNLPESNG